MVGATGDGGTALNAQIAGVIGQNAVENNFLSENISKVERHKNISQFDKEMQECKAKGGDCSAVIKKSLAYNNAGRQRGTLYAAGNPD